VRNLEIILEDKKKNDALLAQTTKKSQDLENELAELYQAVMAAMGKGTDTHF